MSSPWDPLTKLGELPSGSLTGLSSYSLGQLQAVPAASLPSTGVFQRGFQKDSHTNARTQTHSLFVLLLLHSRARHIWNLCRASGIVMSLGYRQQSYPEGLPGQRGVRAGHRKRRPESLVVQGRRELDSGGKEGNTANTALEESLIGNKQMLSRTE